jgi:hypothetical protein
VKLKCYCTWLDIKNFTLFVQFLMLTGVMRWHREPPTIRVNTLKYCGAHIDRLPLPIGVTFVSYNDTLHILVKNKKYPDVFILDAEPLAKVDCPTNEFKLVRYNNKSAKVRYQAGVYYLYEYRNDTLNILNNEY